MGSGTAASVFGRVLAASADGAYQIIPLSVKEGATLRALEREPQVRAIT